MKKLFLFVFILNNILTFSQSKKVTELSEDATINNNDLLYVVDQSTTSKKMRMDTLLETIGDTADVIRTELGDTAAVLRGEIAGGASGWSRSGNYTYTTNNNDSVSVGTSTPSHKFYVNGDIGGTGNLILSDTLKWSVDVWIDRLGNDLQFRDLNNTTPITLSDLYSDLGSGNVITVDGSGNIDLGGNSDDDISLTMNPLHDFSLTYEPVWDTYLKFIFGGQADLRGQTQVNIASDYFVTLTTDSTEFRLDYDGSLATDTYFKDSRSTPVGLCYYADYSSSFIDNSLVSKLYVDNNTGEVDTSGTPSVNQVAYWTSATKIGGNSNFKYDGLTLTIFGGTEAVYIGSSNTGDASGATNTAVGYDAMASGFLSGAENCAFGWRSMYSNTTGDDNVAFGQSSLYDNTSGSNNSAFGKDALGNNTSGLENTSVGLASLYTNTTGDYNVAMGVKALRNNSTGNENISIGSYSGYNSTGSGNIFIGDSAGYNETGSNKLYIENSNGASPLIWGDFNTDSLVVNGILNVDSNIYMQKYASLSDTLPLVLYSDGTTARIDTAGKSEVPTWMLSDYKLQPFEDYFNNVLEVGELGLPYKKNGKIYEKHRLNKSPLIANNQILAEIERNYRYDDQLRNEIEGLKAIINNQQRLIDELYKKLKEAYIIR